MFFRSVFLLSCVQITSCFRRCVYHVELFESRPHVNSLDKFFSFEKPKIGRRRKKGKPNQQQIRRKKTPEKQKGTGKTRNRKHNCAFHLFFKHDCAPLSFFKKQSFLFVEAQLTFSLLKRTIVLLDKARLCFSLFENEKHICDSRQSTVVLFREAQLVEKLIWDLKYY